MLLHFGHVNVPSPEYFQPSASTTFFADEMEYALAGINFPHESHVTVLLSPLYIGILLGSKK